MMNNKNGRTDNIFKENSMAVRKTLIQQKPKSQSADTFGLVFGSIWFNRFNRLLLDF